MLEHKFTTIEKTRVHYVERNGRGQEILFIHAWPMSWKIFDEVMPKMARNFRLVAVDLPGFGHSTEMEGLHTIDNYVTFLEKFTEKIGFSNYSVVGVSYGSILAVKLAVRHPKRIRSLALNGVPYFHKRLSSRLTRYLARMVVSRRPTNRIFHFYNKSRIKKRIYFLDNRFVKKYIKPERLDAYFYDFKGYSNRAARESLAEVLKIDIRKEIPEINQPVLVLASLQDSMIKLKWVCQMVSMLKNGSMVCIDQADHACVVEHPKEFAEQIDRFIGSDALPR